MTGVLPPSSKTFSILQDETLRIVQLVEDVLQLAKADAAHDDLNLESIDVGQMLREIGHAYGHAFHERSIRVHLDMPSVPVSRGQTVSAWGRCFSQPDRQCHPVHIREGEVVVRLETGPETIRICYGNPAGGLTPEDLPYIFERFYRGEKVPIPAAWRGR